MISKRKGAAAPSDKEKSAFRAALPLTLPVMAGYVFLGFAFGLLMVSEGFAPWIPVTMSIAIFSGALEFAAVPFFSAPPDPANSFIFGFLLSVRHIFYGIPMLKKYENAGALKIPMIFWLTDETFSVSCASDPPPGTDRTGFYAWIGFLDHCYWIGGTALGALLGEMIGADLEGLDFALTALFLVLFIEQFKGRSGKFGGICGIAAAALALALFGSANMVPAAMIIMLVLLLAGKRRIENE